MGPPARRDVMSSCSRLAAPHRQPTDGGYRGLCPRAAELTEWGLVMVFVAGENGVGQYSGVCDKTTAPGSGQVGASGGRLDRRVTFVIAIPDVRPVVIVQSRP